MRFTLQGPEPVDVMVQLECQIGNRWTPARRYDTAHGALHVHSAPWDQATDTRTAVRVETLSEGLTAAIAELRANWTDYRRACETALEGARHES